jgi:hypothetical protein
VYVPVGSAIVSLVIVVDSEHDVPHEAHTAVVGTQLMTHAPITQSAPAAHSVDAKQLVVQTPRPAPASRTSPGTATHVRPAPQSPPRSHAR